MNIKNIIIFSWIVFLSVSCQNYLDKDPDSSLNIPIDSEEKIAELLTGAYPQASYFPFLETRTDNVMERDNGIHSQLNEAMFFWEDYEQEDLDTPLFYWNACYAGIAQVNKALELLASYPKTNRVKALYGEAFLLRAYLHFMLVNIWAEPYAGARSSQSMGIPYLTKPEKYALVDYERGSVAQVYDKIEEDLKLGISLVDDKYYQKPKYHFNKKAAYAFASRFYLMKAEWDLVIQYADYVLGADPKKVLRNWASYEEDYTFNRKNLFRSYTNTEQEANLLLTTTESRIARNIATEKFGVTTNTMDAIFNNKGIEACDAGSKLRLSMSYLFSSSNAPINNGMYIAKFDELSLFGNVSTSPRDLYVTNVLFTTDEVFLNRTEAYAMKKEYDLAINNIKEFMTGKYGRTTVPSCENDTYTSISNSYYDTYSPFYGLTIKQLALIKIISDFRQKEFLHEGLRWLDIRRFYIPIARTSRSGTYNYRPLRKEDPRKLLQIPAEAIRRGLTPNPR
ncbi:MAG: RagB/SusD family nutrient uptake outer membrane protein [Capnocytophaga sp.]|nr:RagB/SusD family nutrient uptake outer membrane protein [Capnocytophaga sp.]